MVFPILPMVISKKAKEVGNGGLWKTSKFEISNGHNWGAIWSYRAVSTTVGTARTWSCSGEGSQGAWGLGLWEQVERCFIFGPFVFEFFKKNEKMTKSVKFARIGLISIQNESPHRVLDSSGFLLAKLLTNNGTNQIWNFTSFPDFRTFPRKSPNKRLGPTFWPQQVDWLHQQLTSWLL